MESDNQQESQWSPSPQPEPSGLPRLLPNYRTRRYELHLDFVSTWPAARLSKTSETLSEAHHTPKISRLSISSSRGTIRPTFSTEEFPSVAHAVARLHVHARANLRRLAFYAQQSLSIHQIQWGIDEDNENDAEENSLGWFKKQRDPLDASSLSEASVVSGWWSATQASSPALSQADSFTHDQHQLWIELGQSVPANRRLLIQISYTLPLNDPSQGIRASKEQGLLETESSIFSPPLQRWIFLDLYPAWTLLPCLDETESQLSAPLSIFVCAPSSLTCLSSAPASFNHPLEFEIDENELQMDGVREGSFTSREERKRLSPLYVGPPHHTGWARMDISPSAKPFGEIVASSEEPLTFGSQFWEEPLDKDLATAAQILGQAVSQVYTSHATMQEASTERDAAFSTEHSQMQGLLQSPSLVFAEGSIRASSDESPGPPFVAPRQTIQSIFPSLADEDHDCYFPVRIHHFKASSLTRNSLLLHSQLSPEFLRAETQGGTVIRLHLAPELLEGTDCVFVLDLARRIVEHFEETFLISSARDGVVINSPLRKVELIVQAGVSVATSGCGIVLLPQWIAETSGFEDDEHGDKRQRKAWILSLALVRQFLKGPMGHNTGDSEYPGMAAVSLAVHLALHLMHKLEPQWEVWVAFEQHWRSYALGNQLGRPTVQGKGNPHGMGEWILQNEESVGWSPQVLRGVLVLQLAYNYLGQEMITTAVGILIQRFFGKGFTFSDMGIILNEVYMRTETEVGSSVPSDFCSELFIAPWLHYPDTEQNTLLIRIEDSLENQEHFKFIPSEAPRLEEGFLHLLNPANLSSASFSRPKRSPTPNISLASTPPPTTVKLVNTPLLLPINPNSKSYSSIGTSTYENLALNDVRKQEHPPPSVVEPFLPKPSTLSEGALSLLSGETLLKSSPIPSLHTLGPFYLDLASNDLWRDALAHLSTNIPPRDRVAFAVTVFDLLPFWMGNKGRDDLERSDKSLRLLEYLKKMSEMCEPHAAVWAVLVQRLRPLLAHFRESFAWYELRSLTVRCCYTCPWLHKNSVSWLTSEDPLSVPGTRRSLMDPTLVAPPSLLVSLRRLLLLCGDGNAVHNARCALRLLGSKWAHPPASLADRNPVHAFGGGESMGDDHQTTTSATATTTTIADPSGTSNGDVNGSALTQKRPSEVKHPVPFPIDQICWQTVCLVLEGGMRHSYEPREWAAMLAMLQHASHGKFAYVLEGMVAYEVEATPTGQHVTEACLVAIFSIVTEDSSFGKQLQKIQWALLEDFAQSGFTSEAPVLAIMENPGLLSSALQNVEALWSRSSHLAEQLYAYAQKYSASMKVAAWVHTVFGGEPTIERRAAWVSYVSEHWTWWAVQQHQLDDDDTWNSSHNGSLDAPKKLSISSSCLEASGLGSQHSI